MAELPNKTYAIQDSARQWSQNLSEFQPQPQIDLHCSSEVVQLTWFHCILVFFSEGNMADEIKGVLKDRIDCSADLAEAQLAAAKDVVAHHDLKDDGGSHMQRGKRHAGIGGIDSKKAQSLNRA